MDDLNSNTNTSSIDDPSIEGTGKTNYNYQKTPPITLCETDKLYREIEFKTRYFHEITQEQADSTSDVIITLPEAVYDNQLIKVQAKFGLMDYGSHYIIENSGNDLKILNDYVNLSTGDFIEIFIYVVPFNQPDPIFIGGASSIISTTDETPERASMVVEWALTSTSTCKTEVFVPMIIVE